MRDVPVQRYASVAMLLGALFVALGLAGCDSSAIGSGGADEPDREAAAPSPLVSMDAEAVFDADYVPVFQLALAESAWQALRRDAILEEYTEASLRFEGEELGVVGLRFKGGAGTLYSCVDDEGNLSCSKLSMKIKFSKYDKDKRFYGLKTLNFHSMVRDPTKMAEKISYRLYRDMGVKAPRAHWAELEINGESLGLFALVEQIDSQFTEDRWPEDRGGNLYKEVWPHSDDPEVYQAALKTNEDEAEHGAMIDFHEAMAMPGATGDLSTLGQWADLESLYAFMAVNDAIANWDGVTAWHCGSADCSPHNFYWYQHTFTPKFSLVPWDLDQTLRINTATAIVPHWSTRPADCFRRFAVSATSEVAAPGCDPVFEALATDFTRFSDAVRALIDGPFNRDTLLAQIDGYWALIRDSVGNDPALNGIVSWESAVDTMKTELDYLLQRLLAIQARVHGEPLRLPVDALSSFEEADSLGLHLSVAVSSNPASTVSIELNSERAQSGEQDILVRFSYRDEGDRPWGPWSLTSFALAAAPVDFTGLSGMRIRLRSDAPRSIRINMESPAYSAPGGGVKYGWETEADIVSKVVTVRFDEADYPSWADPLPDYLADVRAAVTAISVAPLVIGQNDQGFLGEGVEDSGELYIDAIEFF